MGGQIVRWSGSRRGGSISYDARSIHEKARTVTSRESSHCDVVPCVPPWQVHGAHVYRTFVGATRRQAINNGCLYVLWLPIDVYVPPA